MGRGAPKGNKNATKGKPWEESLRRALSRRSGTVADGLDPIADKVVALAVSGDAEAMREIACRLDGKPTERLEIDQSVEFSIEDRDSILARAAEAVERIKSGALREDSGDLGPDRQPRH